MVVEGLPTPDERELAALRAGRRVRYARLLVSFSGAAIAFLIVVLVGLYLYHINSVGAIDPSGVRQQLLSLRVEWAVPLADRIDTYREWFREHGTNTEALLFDQLSSILTTRVVEAVEGFRGEAVSLFASGKVLLFKALIRLSFLVLASLRLWLACVVVGVAQGMLAFKPYAGDDVLGQSGNGRVFYSGIRAALDKVTPEGEPDYLVRGLACPRAASLSQTRASELWKILDEHGAVNRTNEALAAIVIHYTGTAPYVAAPGEEGLLAAAFAGTSLEENCEAVLGAVLSLHALYVSGDINRPDFGGEKPPTGTPLMPSEYALALRAALHRVLSVQMRQQVAQLPADEVATAVLAFESGKVLAHSHEGGRWIRRSNFPALSARAIMHSVVEFPIDYDFDARMRLRRALIYSARRSAFAPVRMPTDLTPQAWALRQWIEVCSACPHELEAVADEVELVGLVRVAHQGWMREFLDTSVQFNTELTTTCYVTPSNLLFVPLSHVVTVLQRGNSAQELERLDHLVTVVSNRQKLKALEGESSESGIDPIFAMERVVPPLQNAEVATLAKLHGVSEDQLRAWSALRIVLTSQGWLARRVGDYSVPDSAVIFAVFRAHADRPGVNPFGFLGTKGMVAFRGSKLEERWGRNWAQRFQSVFGVTMAETSEDYGKLLQGIDDKDLAEELERVE